MAQETTSTLGAFANANAQSVNELVYELEKQRTQVAPLEEKLEKQGYVLTEEQQQWINQLKEHQRVQLTIVEDQCKQELERLNQVHIKELASLSEEQKMRMK